jgi:two-component system chemotaxis sensor kinase CheA
MSDARARVLGVFREESSERLDRIVEGLLALERGAGPDAIDAVLREAHSIKGSAGMMGIDDAHDIGHAIEEVLATARADARLAPGLVEPLLHATDALRRAVAGEAGLVQDAVAAIARAASGEAAADMAEAEAPATPALPGAGTSPPSMRVEAGKVDRLLDAVGEVVVHQRRLEHVLSEPGDGRRHDAAQDVLARSDGLLDELQDAVIRLRTVPISSITGPFPRAVRDLAAAHGKEVRLTTTGTGIQLDRVILEGASEAIVHLLRNAVAHGIEPPGERERAGKPREGRIELRAQRRGDRVAIEVRDDGRGVAPELLGSADGPEALATLLARAGMSTAQSVTAVSGRGVGLDAVKHHVESVRGSLEVASEPGRGTTVSLLLPVNVALVDALVLERAGILFAVPFADVSEVIRVAEPLSLLGRPAVAVEGEPVPMADLVAVLGGSGPPVPTAPPAIVLARGSRRAALVCDRLVGEETVVVKRLGSVLAATPGYIGGAIMGDGRVALVLDAQHLLSAATDRPAAMPAAEPEAARRTVLVVDDQFTVRELQRSIMEASGYSVETARDGREAWERLTASEGVALVVTDLEMPEMDGLELLAAIRRDPQMSSLPVVIVTSRAGAEDERLGMEAGADAYIVKERFDQQALLDTVGRLIGR